MSHEQISCRLPEEKQKCLYIHSSIKRKKVKKKKKKQKKRGCRAVFRSLPNITNIYDGVFLRKYNG